MKKLPIAVAIAALLTITPLAGAKDLGLFYGEPTPAYAMYIAQANAAAENCTAVGLIREEKASSKFMKHFNNGTEVSAYTKKDEAFAERYQTFQATYQAAWDAATPDVRDRFCGAYNDDVAGKEAKGIFKFAPQIMYFRFTFSPKTEESLARARKWINILSVGTTIATTSATISSGRDSVAAAKAGDWNASNQLMAQSRSFNQVGAGVVAMNNAAQGAAIEPPVMAVMEEQGTDGTMRIVPCPVVDHFFNYMAPSESPVWTTYMSVHMACRSPVAGDLERM